MDISPSRTPRTARTQTALLPSFLQPQPQPAEPEAAALLARGSGLVAAAAAAAAAAAGGGTKPRQWPWLFYALLAVGLVWFVAAGGGSRAMDTGLQQQALPPPVPVASTDSSGSGRTGSSVASSGSSSPATAQPVVAGTAATAAAAQQVGTAGTQQPACPYGSLPGTWVSSAPAGAKWQVLDRNCQLTNWLAAYAAAASGGTPPGSSNDAAVQAVLEGMDGLPPVRLLLLSDSVDRFMMQHVCDYLAGHKHTTHMAALPPAAMAADQQATSASSSSNSTSPGPSSLNATAYAFHTCEFGPHVPLKVASSYFPGVHPTGPFHRGLTQNYAVRIEAAASMWDSYAGASQPPHAVGVASSLWDVARLWFHERQELEGRSELSMELLQGWMANFTTVVDYSRQRLPQTQLWLTHTTMLPAHDVHSGVMKKPYLGRRYFIEQLNAAAASAASRLDLQLVNYAALAAPFAEQQRYLADLIHPNAEVALEVFNVLLNLVLSARGL